MKKLFKEFKAFISRGNVMELAVGMIVGAAFTAIISAVVGGILKPLINLIPISDTTGLQTVLRPALIDPETGSVLTEALVIDWGGVISAVITFLLTAIVLFIIIKAFNKMKSGLSKVKNGYTVLSKEEVKALRKEGKSRKEIKEIDAKKAEEKKAADEKAAEEEKAAAEANDPANILKEIRDILKEKK